MLKTRVRKSADSDNNVASVSAVRKELFCFTTLTQAVDMTDNNTRLPQQHWVTLIKRSDLLVRPDGLAEPQINKIRLRCT